MVQGARFRVQVVSLKYLDEGVSAGSEHMPVLQRRGVAGAEQSGLPALALQKGWRTVHQEKTSVLYTLQCGRNACGRL